MPRIKELCQVEEETKVTALLLDLEDEGAFYEITEPITGEVVRKTMEHFKAGTLQKKHIKN